MYQVNGGVELVSPLICAASECGGGPRMCILEGRFIVPNPAICWLFVSAGFSRIASSAGVRGEDSVTQYETAGAVSEVLISLPVTSTESHVLSRYF